MPRCTSKRYHPLTFDEYWLSGRQQDHWSQKAGCFRTKPIRQEIKEVKRYIWTMQKIYQAYIEFCRSASSMTGAVFPCLPLPRSHRRRSMLPAAAFGSIEYLKQQSIQNIHLKAAS